MFSKAKSLLMAIFPMFLFFFFSISLVAFAQDAGVTPPSQDDWSQLLASLNGLKGAGALAIAAVVTQALMLALRSKLGEYAGKYRLLAVSLISLVSGILALSAAGVNGPALFLHGTTLAAFQVFANQLIKQFGTEKGNEV